MAKLKIQTGDGTMVPGADTAEKQKQEQDAKAEYQANLLYKEANKVQDAGPDYTYSKIRFHKSDEVNIYAAEQDARYGLDPRIKKLVIIGVVLFIVFVLACILPTQVFSRPAPQRAIGLLASELAAQFQGFIGFFTNTDTMYGSYILTVLVTLLAGAALGLSGGIFQGSLKNALASPSTLGVTSGGTIGAIIYSVFVYPNLPSNTFNGSYSELLSLYGSMSPLQIFLSSFGGFICSFLGCAIIVFLIMLIATIAGRGKVNNVALVVAGQVFTTLIALIVSWIRMFLTTHGETDMATYLAQTSTMTFTGAYTVSSVALFAIPLLACMIFCFCMARKLSLLAFNDEEARSMGISTTRTRNTMVAVCTVMTALVVSFCGPVSFVGFMVPHIARKLIGPDFRYLLPACALIGGLMVTAVFYVTQLGIPYIVNGSTGVITGVIGCVSFLIIALRGRGSSGAQWL